MSEDRVVILHATIRVVGEDTPTIEITKRIGWPADETLEQLAERELRDACRELHRPKPQWRLA